MTLVFRLFQTNDRNISAKKQISLLLNSCFLSKFADCLDLFAFGETSYLKTDMCKSES